MSVYITAINYSDFIFDRLLTINNWSFALSIYRDRDNKLFGLFSRHPVDGTMVDTNEK